MTNSDDPAEKRPAKVLALIARETQLDTVRRGNRVLGRIAADALGSLPQLAERRWKVGNYEVNERTYRQIMIWLDHFNSNGRALTLDAPCCHSEDELGV